MKSFSLLMGDTRFLLTDLFGEKGMTKNPVETNAAIQAQTTAESQDKRKANTRFLEVQEDARKQIEIVRRRALSTPNLRLDLESEYGTSRWARRLIDDLMWQRTQVADISFPIAGQ